MKKVKTKRTPTGDGDMKFGVTIRRLRRQHGLTQAAMADRLGISAPYLNLIEHNRRRITAALLVKLGDVFGLEFADLAGTDESQLLAHLMEAFSDPLFASQDLTNTDVRDVVTTNPTVAQAILALYDGYRKAQNDIGTLAERLSGNDGEIVAPEQADLPADSVTDFLQVNANHFPDLEEAAEQVRADAELDAGDLFPGMVGYLQDAYGGL
ncbi:MAG: helix-turn-helix domain-containing protein, partial [Rhodospirillales bacterium]